MAKAKDNKGGKLTPRMRAFVHAYAKNGGNGKQAAISAGYSEKSADVQASRLLRNVRLQQEISKVGQKAEVLAQVSVAEVLNELKRIAFADIRQAFTADGRLKPIQEIPEDVARALSGIETEELWDDDGEGGRMRTGDVRKVKFWNKNEALKDLGKHLKLFTDVVEHRVTLGDLIEASLQTEADE